MMPPLPDFDALRHGAPMDCEDADEARDLLRHGNSNVTRAIYRAHFTDKRTRGAASPDGGAPWKRYGSNGPQQVAGRGNQSRNRSARFAGDSRCGAVGRRDSRKSSKQRVVGSAQEGMALGHAPLEGHGLDRGTRTTFADVALSESATGG
jgi:hypothetical protein